MIRKLGKTDNSDSLAVRLSKSLSFQSFPKQGQAMVMVLLITVILVIVSTMSVALIISNAYGTMRVEDGQHALEIAESGIEEGILRTIRDPSYVTSASLSLTVDAGSATVDVSGTGTKTITSRGVVGGYSRTVQAQIHFSAGNLVVDSWKEI